MSLIKIRQIIAAFAFGSPLGALLVAVILDMSLENPPGVVALVVGAWAISMIICGVFMIKNVGQRLRRSDYARDEGSPSSD